MKQWVNILDHVSHSLLPRSRKSYRGRLTPAIFRVRDLDPDIFKNIFKIFKKFIVTRCVEEWISKISMPHFRK